MVASIHEFCNDARWQFTTPDDSKYNLGEALGDLTGVGAFYNLGGDMAIMQRNQRMIDWIRGVNPGQSAKVKRLLNNHIEFFETKNRMLFHSVIGKVAYVSAAALALVGTFYNPALQGVGVAGMCSLAVYFMGRAGFNATDCSLGEREKYLSSERCNLV